jgi:hypothetical protein
VTARSLAHHYCLVHPEKYMMTTASSSFGYPLLCYHYMDGHLQSLEPLQQHSNNQSSTQGTSAMNSNEHQTLLPHLDRLPPRGTHHLPQCDRKSLLSTCAPRQDLVIAEKTPTDKQANANDAIRKVPIFQWNTMSAWSMPDPFAGCIWNVLSRRHITTTDMVKELYTALGQQADSP